MVCLWRIRGSAQTTTLNHMARAKPLPDNVKVNGKLLTKHGCFQFSFLVTCISCGVDRVVKRKEHAVAMSIKPCKRCSNKSNHPQGQVGNIRVSFFNSYCMNAADRGKSWDLSIEEASEILESQELKCALTGLPINACGDFNTITASLDRIDNADGYSKGNVQWVHKEVNMLRGVLSITRFKELCSLVASHSAAQQTSTP